MKNKTGNQELKADQIPGHLGDEWDFWWPVPVESTEESKE